MPLRRDRGQLQELQRLRASAAAGIVSSSGRGVVPTSRRAGGRALRTARHRVGPPPGPCHPVAACVRLPRVPGTDGARPRAGGRHVDAGRRASPSQAGHSDSAASARSQRLTESRTSHRILRSDGGRPRSPGRRRTPSFGDVLRGRPASVSTSGTLGIRRFVVWSRVRGRPGSRRQAREPSFGTPGVLAPANLAPPAAANRGVGTMGRRSCQFLCMMVEPLLGSVDEVERAQLNQS